MITMSIVEVNFLCNKTFAQANSTGFHSIFPKVGADSGPSNGTYAVTTYSNATGVMTDLWYNTGGANYSDPQALGYEVCWIAMPILSKYASELAGTSDNLDCSVALSETCASDMAAFAITSATKIYANLTPEQQVPASLADICDEIGKAVIQDVPSSCAPYFDNNGGVKTYGMTYSTTDTDDLYTGTPACVMAEDVANIKNLNATSDVFWSVGGSFRNPTEQSYIDDEHYVLPVMTIFTPYLSNSNLSDHSILAPQTYLSCMRNTHFNSGSQVVAALPVHSPSPPASSTPSTSPNSSNSLSGGDIAGIVIGVLAFVALILIAILIFIRRKKQQRKRRLAEENRNRDDIAEIGGGTGKVEADSNNAWVGEAAEKRNSAIDGGELPGVSKDMHHEIDDHPEDDRKVELASEEFHELPTADVLSSTQQGNGDEGGGGEDSGVVDEKEEAG